MHPSSYIDSCTSRGTGLTIETNRWQWAVEDSGNPGLVHAGRLGGAWGTRTAPRMHGRFDQKGIFVTYTKSGPQDVGY